MAQMIRHSPIPENELSTNLGLYLSRMQIGRLMLMHQLFQQILPVMESSWSLVCVGGRI
jgi:hypothetical protein